MAASTRSRAGSAKNSTRRSARCALLVEVPAQRRYQPQVIQKGWTKLQRELAHLLQEPFEDRNAIVQPPYDGGALLFVRPPQRFVSLLTVASVGQQPLNLHLRVIRG